MKKTLLTLLAVMMMAAATAKPVSPRQAMNVAERFFPGVTLTVEQLDAMYLFTPADGNGFVLVAADDCVLPVLAYSRSAHFDSRNMPAHVAEWIEGYSREIKAFANTTPSAEVTAAWNASPKTDSSDTGVGPLMTTRWNQAPYFNLMCPYDNVDSARSVVGCVATATAQIMKYWNHPEVGFGSNYYYHPSYGWLGALFDTTHYRWNLMPDTLNGLCSEAEIYATAELSYHVGVAVNMDYSPSASGAQVCAYGGFTYPSAENALKSYFKYNPLLYSVFKSEHTDSAWDALMRNEIDESRPILFSGHDSAGGHAFVLDGYDSIGFFHVNWGWGGYYDGYYTLDSLAPGAGGIGGNATYTFNMNNAAVIGIYPAQTTDDTLAVIDMTSNSTTMGSVTGSGTYSIYDTVSIVAHAAEGCRFVRWASGNSSNPMNVIACGNMVDTAIFERLLGDTIGYTSNAMRSSWRDDYTDTTEWGIRIPLAMRHQGRKLTGVQMFVYVAGQYTLNVYQGDSINGSSPVYTQELYLYDSLGWNTVELDDPLLVSNHKPLWITVRYVGGPYEFPAAMSRYCGNSDGCWYRLPEGWRTYDHLNQYMTWMLRAVLEPIPCTVEVIAENPDVCTVYGGGEYMGGDTVTIGAIILNSNCWFYQWSDGTPTTPYSFVVGSDTTFVARCHCEGVGIYDVDTEMPVVSIDGRTVCTDIPALFYDMQGRLIGEGTRFTAPASGVYVARFGSTARKIVIYR